jgi:hypothetical protein
MFGGLMKKIKLTQGKWALVDDEDYERINKFKWCAAKDRYTFYAIRGKWKDGRVIPIKMHREILNAGKGEQVDHSDRDGLNNQKSNIRICSVMDNAHNKRKRRNNTTGYVGVFFRKNRNTFQAYIRRKILGSFHDPKDAAKEYDKAAKKLYGEFASINFS